MDSSDPVTPVVIVGAGLAGLTTAIGLGVRRVPAILLERRPKLSGHPRADGFTARTVEIFRSLGLGSNVIPENPPGFRTRRSRVESLTGQWFEELAWNPQGDDNSASLEAEYSPYRGTSTPQDQLEPILLEYAAKVGVDVRMHHEFVGLSQDAQGVTAIIKDHAASSMYTVRAQYLVAADGHRSAVRETLAIGRKGHGSVNYIQSVLFRAPEVKPFLQKGVKQFTIDQPTLKAFMIVYQDERLVLHLPDNRQYDDETIRQVTLQAIGPAKVTLDIIATSRWEMSASIADEFARGRVFLVGDAAHSLPPNRGGYGANTGIADGHNLAWKLAHVIRGVSDAQLLETYTAERLPVAWLRHDQIFARSDYKTLQEKPAASENGSSEKVALADATVEFGQIYRSTGILGADDTLPDAQRPELWKGQPGTRAPHIWLQTNGQAVSTLELFKGDWVVLSEDGSWEEIVGHVGKKLGLDTKFIHVCQSPNAPLKFGEICGLPPAGCCLVRPDGYIAWRLVELEGDLYVSLEEAWKKVSHWRGLHAQA